MAETLLQKAQRLGMKPAGTPTVNSAAPSGETLLQKAQRLGIKPANPPKVATAQPATLGNVLNSGMASYDKNVAEPVKNAATDFTKNWLSEAQGGADDVWNAVKGGAEAISQSSKQGNFPKFVEDVGRTGLEAALGAGRSVFAPLTAGIQTASEKIAPKIQPNSLAGHVLDKVDSVQKHLSNISQKYPDASRDISDIVNFALFAIGDKVGGEGLNSEISSKGLSDVLKSTASDVKSGAKFVGDVSKLTGENIGSGAKALLSPERTLESKIAESKQILNPTGKYTPTEAEKLYATGEVKTQGVGPFKKEVASLKPTLQDEALSDLVEKGKISAKKLPSENIKSIKQEVSVLDRGIDDFVNKKELNTPHTKAVTAKTLDGVFSEAKKNRIFVSKSVEENAFKDVIDIAKEETNKFPQDKSGLRKAIKSFNQRMEDLLGNDIYSSEEGNSVGNSRIRAAKEVRTALNNQLASGLDRAQVLETLKVLKPEEATPLIDKAENFPRKEDFIRNQKEVFEKKVMDDTSYRAEKRRIMRSMEKDGLTLEQARAKEGIFIDAESDLSEIWEIAHTDVNSTGGGSLYKQQLQKEAQLLNATDEIGYKSRGTIGKSKIKQYINKRPLLKKAVIGGSIAAGGYVGGETAKDILIGK